jgi:hypothetical protein
MLAGEFADAGDQFPLGHGSIGDSKLDLPHDLIVDGQLAIGIDVEKHGAKVKV